MGDSGSRYGDGMGTVWAGIEGCFGVYPDVKIDWNRKVNWNKFE